MEEAFRLRVVDDVPTQQDPFVFYLLENAGAPWCAVFLCPCGCGDPVWLNLAEGVRPKWTVNKYPIKKSAVGPSVFSGDDSSMSFDLSPSVHRSVGCKSHFFLKAGEVEWCGGKPGGSGDGISEQ